MGRNFLNHSKPTNIVGLTQLHNALRLPHQRPLLRREAVEVEHHVIYLAVSGLDVGEEAEGAGALLLKMCEPLGFYSAYIWNYVFAAYFCDTKTLLYG